QVVVNGWFWGQLATGSGQYLHALARHLPQIAASESYTLALPKARFPDATGKSSPEGGKDAAKVEPETTGSLPRIKGVKQAIVGR
ncbi:hypothetical protein, partial [Bradyrhizobium sp.]|uniref:hypothetical protein n=1 Tax=Bradyrhizobium sp. TaxID=376 RepID=UPI00391CACBB